MTTQSYIDQNITDTLLKGDKVLMHSCFEATFKENFNKVFICQTDSFLARDKSEVVFLEDFSGYFLVKFLSKVI